MFKFGRFLSLTLLMIGGLIGASMLTNFSVAQSFELTEGSLTGKSFSFLMPNHSVYFYAHTEPNEYIIYFDENGGTGTMDSMGMVYDQERNLLPNTFTYEGHTFKGWSDNPGGPVIYLDQTGVINLTTENGGEVVLYAQRDIEVPYIIEYYHQNLSGDGYDLFETGSMYGTAGTGIIFTGRIYTGFELQTGAEISIVSGGVVPYYYTRKTYLLTVKDRGTDLLVTGVKYGADIPLPPVPLWTGNTVTGWNNLPGDGKMPYNDLVIETIWSYGVHTITFDTNGGTEIPSITAKYGDSIVLSTTPTKTGYDFVRWEPALPDKMPFDDIVVKAIWKESGKGMGWSGGGGRKGGTSDTPSGEDQHGASEEHVQPLRGMEDLETFFAYMWAHDMGIIEESWEESDPDGYVTRGDMAEMVVKFTEKVLGRGIPSILPKECVWGDLDEEWKSPEAKMYAEKACALGVMGIRMQNFMPNKVLDRAEFGTILSRLLWGSKYDVVDASKTKLYYTRHLNALKKNKIMTDISDPEEKKEFKKWAWLMLMRSRIEEIENR